MEKYDLKSILKWVDYLMTPIFLEHSFCWMSFFFYLNDLAAAAATIEFAYSFATERKHWHYKSFDYVIMCRRKNNGVFY